MAEIKDDGTASVSSRAGKIAPLPRIAAVGAWPRLVKRPPQQVAASGQAAADRADRTADALRPPVRASVHRDSTRSTANGTSRGSRLSS